MGKELMDMSCLVLEVCLSTPAIIGITVGIVFFVLLLLIGVAIFLAKKCKDEDADSEASEEGAGSLLEKADPSMAPEDILEEEKLTEDKPSSSLYNSSIITLTSSYNKGLALWTAICVAFSDIFGCHSKMYDKKVKSVTIKIKKDLKSQMESYSSLYEFGDIRITSDKSLSFVGSVTGKLKNK